MIVRYDTFDTAAAVEYYTSGVLNLVYYLLVCTTSSTSSSTLRVLNLDYTKFSSPDSDSQIAQPCWSQYQVGWGPVTGFKIPKNYPKTGYSTLNPIRACFGYFKATYRAPKMPLDTLERY